MCNLFNILRLRGNEEYRCEKIILRYFLIIIFLLNIIPVSGQLRDKLLPKPSSQQYDWQEQERSMFIHFGPATWQGREYDNHSTPLNRINPTKLNTDQWCQVAKSWGAKEIIFVAKHVGGFCWWPTHTTNYCVRNIPWKHGKGDLLRMVANSCKKYGLKLGIYIYPGDERYGAGIGSGGRTEDTSMQAAYNKIYREQLKEVLSRYGQISEVWFDGSCVINVKDILTKYAKNAVIFQGPEADIRWSGNEDGILNYPVWYTLSKSALRTGVATQEQSDPNGNAYAPLEADVTLYNHFWFWSPKAEKKRRNVHQLMNIYCKSVGRGGKLLLDSSPDTTGLISKGDVKIYKAFGQEIKRQFGNPIAEVKNKTGYSVEIDLPRPEPISCSMLMEDYRQGQRIRQYLIEGYVNHHWKEIANGISVGYKRINVFPPVVLQKVRLRIAQSVGTPLIRKFSLFNNTLYKYVGSNLTQSDTSKWQKCGSWDGRNIQKNEATITFNLTKYIKSPGQYELTFVPTNSYDKMKIVKATIEYGNGNTLQQFLIRKSDYTFEINRTAQVTKESKSQLVVNITLTGPDTRGIVYIRKK